MGKRHLAVALATWFYSGYFPVAPGTFGSICAWAPAWLAAQRLGVPSWAFALAAAALAPLAVWSAEAASAEFGSEDPAKVVIDEVVGVLIAVATADAASWVQWVAALALFRLIDITKPFGIRRLESLRGGWGVLADDVAAGACAMICVALLRWTGL